MGDMKTHVSKTKWTTFLITDVKVVCWEAGEGRGKGAIGDGRESVEEKGQGEIGTCEVDGTKDAGEVEKEEEGEREKGEGKLMEGNGRGSSEPGGRWRGTMVGLSPPPSIPEW
jgi:hypothetical protein